jgi:hypothetical protein
MRYFVAKVRSKQMAKTRIYGVLMSILLIGCVVIGCASNPAPSKTSGPGEIAGTVWVFSVSGASITYTFEDSTYKVKYAGSAFILQYALAEQIAKLSGVEAEYGTGTYSVSGQTVTLRPVGGNYLSVDASGKIEIKKVEAFTVTIVNNTFTLDGITFKKTE